MSPPDVVVELGDLLKGNRFVIFFSTVLVLTFFFFFSFFYPFVSSKILDRITNVILKFLPKPLRR